MDKKLWYIYIYEISYYSTTENEILSFAKTWMDSEGITLSEISQTEIQDTVSYHSYVESKKIF